MLTNTRWYVGVKDNNYTAFRSPTVPTEQTHGQEYHSVIGPFRTKRGAQYMATFGPYHSPSLVTVKDAEYWAKFTRPKTEKERYAEILANVKATRGKDTPHTCKGQGGATLIYWD